MIITSIIWDTYIIGYSMDNDKFCYRYMFHNHFMPANILRELKNRQIFTETQSTRYLLNACQQRSIKAIFRKLIEEQDSGYRYSINLQKNYLLELIHALVKISQHNKSNNLSA